MSIPIHAVTLDRAQVAQIAAGTPVEATTDQHLPVLLVLAEDYTSTSPRNGVQIIPLSHAVLQDLFVTGHTAWLPNSSPFVFSLNADIQ